ncbi:Putative phosphoserine phosphatase 2 [Paraliobacillus sp. PM-2]|uniref:histidine phosphatase family protein n=1 Tax=Paraliobacillus sp. PM-2 TaxID=1462524 RepID=UPI00061BB406|nr:histidine phosphatase family protein [Paraliobacillus sp. PM-2]CQR48234.1 Putative phosphoserine phosphatase 2 [Paraliobacillus sp. PM-2]
MKLYFIRHGQTAWNLEGKIQGSKDVALNSKGIIQAEQLSEKIVESNYKISKIYSSQQKRAIKTAEILSESINTEYIVVNGLEEVNLGEWEGLTWEKAQEKYPLAFDEWFNNRRYTKPPQGESYQDMLNRVLITLQVIVNNNTEDVAIVKHSAVIMTLQCYITNTPFEDMTRFKTDNTSITEIDSELICL